MFGLSWAQIIIIVLVGVFLLGPERIPTAVQWVVSSLTKVRTMAAGAQAQLRSEIGPELDELRRQIADLQSLKELQELRELRDLHPKNLIGKGLFGTDADGSATGLSGFLGLDKSLLDAPVSGSGVAPEHDKATSPGLFGGLFTPPAPNGADSSAGEPAAHVDLGKAEKPHSSGGPAGVTPGPDPAGLPADRVTVPPPFDPDAT